MARDAAAAMRWAWCAPATPRALFRWRGRCRGWHSRAQAMRPARHWSSSQAGSYPAMRAGSNLGLPCAGRRLETFEQGDRGGYRVRPLQTRVVGQPLPGKQETQEVARRDRFDFGAQAADRVVVDAREQAAVAPFLRRSPSRGEAAAQGEALGFQRRSAPRSRPAPVRAAPPARLRHRTETFQAAAHDSASASSRDHARARPVGRGADSGHAACIGPQRLELRQPLGGDPQVRPRRAAATSRGFRPPTSPAIRSIPAPPGTSAVAHESRATAARRAVPRRWRGRARLRRAPARSPRDPAGPCRRRSRGRASAGPSPPACGAPPAARRRETRRAAPTALPAPAAKVA